MYICIDAVVYKTHSHRAASMERRRTMWKGYVPSVFKKSCLFLRPRPWQFEILRFEIMKTDRIEVILNHESDTDNGDSVSATNNQEHTDNDKDGVEICVKGFTDENNCPGKVGLRIPGSRIKPKRRVKPSETQKSKEAEKPNEAEAFQRD